MNFIKNHFKLCRAIFGGALLIFLPFLLKIVTGTEYLVMISCVIMIYSIAVSGFDMLFGYSGQISMGQAAFFSIGAYTTCMLNNYFNWPLFITIPLGAVLACVLGALLAYPASKLKFHFLSLATIAFSEIVYNFVMSSPGDFTGGYRGAYSKSIAGLDNYVKWYFFLGVILAICLVVKYFLMHSRVGRAFLAIRENTHAADGMGVNVRKYKIIAFALSSFYTGLAGAIYAHLIGYISPEICKQKQSALFLTMLLFGGTASMVGPIIGVVVLEILLEVIRPLQEYQLLLYGILMLIVILALPGGLAGGIKDLINSIRGNKMRKAEAKAAVTSDRKDGDK